MREKNAIRSLVSDVALKRFIYLRMEFAVAELFNLLKQRSISFMHFYPMSILDVLSGPFEILVHMDIRVA